MDCWFCGNCQSHLRPQEMFTNHLNYIATNTPNIILFSLNQKNNLIIYLSIHVLLLSNTRFIVYNVHIVNPSAQHLLLIKMNKNRLIMETKFICDFHWYLWIQWAECCYGFYMSVYKSGNSMNTENISILGGN